MLELSESQEYWGLCTGFMDGFRTFRAVLVVVGEKHVRWKEDGCLRGSAGEFHPREILSACGSCGCLRACREQRTRRPQCLGQAQVKLYLLRAPPGTQRWGNEFLPRLLAFPVTVLR